MSGPARAGRRPEVSSAPIRETPVSAEGHCTGARQNDFLFGPRTARFSFGKTKEKWGVQWTGYHHSRIPPGGSLPPSARSSFEEEEISCLS